MRALLHTGMLRRGAAAAVARLHAATAALNAHAPAPSLRSFAQNTFVWWQLFSLPFQVWAHQAASIRSVFSRQFWTAFRHDHEAIHTTKLYVTLSALTLTLFALPSAPYDLLGPSNFGTVLASLIVVMQPAVETTLLRLLYRVLGSALGTTLGFVFMLWPTAAASVPLLCAYLVLLMLPAMQYYESSYRFAVFCFCLRCT